MAERDEADEIAERAVHSLMADYHRGDDPDTDGIAEDIRALVDARLEASAKAFEPQTEEERYAWPVIVAAAAVVRSHKMGRG